MAPLGRATASRALRPHGPPPCSARPDAIAARTHRTKNRVSVRLRFRFPSAQRLFLIVRGPAPSCQIAGVIPYRAHRGVNTVYFAGRVQGRRLEPGIYGLSLSSTREPQPGAPATPVSVVSPRRSIPLQRQGTFASCAAGPTTFGATDDSTSSSILLAASGEGQTGSPTASVAGVQFPTITLEVPKPGGIPDASGEEAGGLLPGSVDGGDVAGNSILGSFATGLVFALLAGLIVGMVVLVSRFLRGNWNP